MNTEFITRGAKKHGSKVAWSSVAAALLTLTLAYLDQRGTSQTNHTASWDAIRELRQRVFLLESNEIFRQGYEAAQKTKGNK